MDKKKKRVLARWLKDVHALETASEQTLKERARAAENFDSETFGALNTYSQKAGDHATRVSVCLERLGESVSAVKTTAAFLDGSLRGRGASLPDDASIRDLIEGYAREHWKIILYRAIIAAAMSAGDVKIIAACEEILAEEREMADWFDQALDPAVRDYLDALAD